jgi:hypothetical protein
LAQTDIFLIFLPKHLEITSTSSTGEENQFNSVTRTSSITPSSSDDVERYHHHGSSNLESDNGFDIGSGELSQNPLDRGPYFDVSVSKNVTVLVGGTAYLKCRVRNLGNKTVSRK